MIGNLVRRTVAPSKVHRNMLSTMTRRTLNDTNSNNVGGSQILMSPSLVSLDVPDIWNSHSNHFRSPSPEYTLNVRSADVISGQSIAEEIRLRIAMEVRRMQESTGEVPGLAVVLVGQRKDSQTYVRNKILACKEVGIRSIVAGFPESCSEEDVLEALASFTADLSVHGVLVQLPLPQHLDAGKISDAVSLEKDVDGFNPVNIGNLAMRGREPLFIPCAPKGCVELLLRSGVEISGKKVAVIGKSNIVGLPASLLFQRHHATVSVVDAFTENPEHVTREADIVIVATGVPNLVRGHWLKPGAVVIDVGTNPIEDPDCEYGYHLKGDVCFEEAVRVASAITPVPGGVGPVTVAMLLSNTLQAAKRALHFA